MSQHSAKQQLEESLSALVDGEITELELRRLLKLDEEQFNDLRDRWVSYQLAGASMKKDVPDVDYVDLSSQISAVIADEPVHSVQKPVAKSSIWTGIGRFAVAASVAGAVVLGVQFSSPGIDQQVVNTPAKSSLDAGISKTVPSARVPSSFENGLPSDATVSTVSNGNQRIGEKKDDIVITENTKQQLKEAESQVNRLLLEHAQNASQNTQQGVLPYARVPESSPEAR